MQLRKLAASIVAAATLMGGVTLGVGTASASEGDAITVDNTTKQPLVITSEPGHPETVDGHKFLAIQIGEYASAVETVAPQNGAGRFADSVEVATPDRDLQGSPVTALLKRALNQVDENPEEEGVQNGYAESSYGKSNPENPMGYIAANYLGYGDGHKDITSAIKPWTGLLRDFVTKLTVGNSTFNKIILSGQDTHKNIFDGTGAITSPEGTPAGQQVAEARIDGWGAADDGVAPGVYVIIDVTSGLTTPETAITMLTGTRIAGRTASDTETQSFDLVGNFNAGYSLGNVTVKSDPVVATKTVAKLKPLKNETNPDSIGWWDRNALAATAEAAPDDYVFYHVSLPMPVNVQDTDETYVIDTPAAGQTLIFDQTDVEGRGTLKRVTANFWWKDQDATGSGGLSGVESRNCVKSWTDANGDNQVQAGELTRLANDKFEADGTTRIVFDFGPLLKAARDSDKSKSVYEVSFEYAAHITKTDAGEVTNAARVQRNLVYSKDSVTTVTVTPKKSGITELPLTGGVGIVVFGLSAMALLGVAVFGANRYRSNRRSLRA